VKDLRDGPRDECGVFGIYGPGHDVARLAYFALYALQHRGQESAGIATCDRGGHIMTLRERGLVSQVFDEQQLRTLGGELAVGHVRYSTTGSDAWENTQPVYRSTTTSSRSPTTATSSTRSSCTPSCARRGLRFSSTSDSEIIAALLADHPAERIEDAVVDVMPRMQGAFSTVVLCKDRVVAFRDPQGLRPLSLGAHRRPVLRRVGDVRLRHHRRRAPARRAAR
jgi:amidophosphoribosyltransferase